MTYFKFCKALSQALILVETSEKPMVNENLDKIIVLSEPQHGLVSSRSDRVKFLV